MSDVEQATATSEDWPAKAANTIVGYVDTVRGATTGKALLISRLAVYFVAIGLIAFVALIIGLIILVRLLVNVTAYVPSVDSGETWLAYWILGALFTLVGMFLWRKRGR